MRFMASMTIGVGLKTQPSAAKIDWTEETYRPDSETTLRRRSLLAGRLWPRPVFRGEAYWRAMGLDAQDGGGAGDGQGQAHHREGHDHIESPVEQDRHFSLHFQFGSRPIRDPLS